MINQKINKIEVIILKIIFTIFLLLINTVLYGEQTEQLDISSEIKNSLANHLHSKDSVIIEKLYENSGYRPLWVGSQNRRKMYDLLSALKDPMYNYKEKDFGRKEIEQLSYMIDSHNINESQISSAYGRLDVAASYSFIALVKFISQGDVDWNLVKKKMLALRESDDIRADWDFIPNTFPDEKMMAIAVMDGNIDSYLDSLIPLKDRYKTLVNIYKRYRNMKSFETIPYSQDVMSMGDSSDRVVSLKRLLRTLGDYPSYLPIDNQFDNALRDAVLRYQKRYNIEQTGKVDNITNYYLNQPLSAHLQSITTNLDKTKLYPRNLEDERIEVNIPSYSLEYFNNTTYPSFRSKAVVGRIDRPTPIFNDMVENLVFNPTWTITDNLVKKDLIPILKTEPDFLTKNNIRVFAGNKEVYLSLGELDQYEKSSAPVPFRFTQDPGDLNALGRVKFNLPNKYDVYLHDTDNPTLFSRRYRVYSSGCMRLQKPLVLAKMLVNSNTNGRYDDKKVDEILDSMKTTTVPLSQKVPIHTLYFTTRETDGLIYFDYDIYMYDLIISESTASNRKNSFKVPDKRLISVDKNAKVSKLPDP